MNANRQASHLARLALISALLAALTVGCTKSEDSDKIDTPKTVFDQTEPDPRSNEMKLNDFIVVLERKYRREDHTNAIDLHFTLGAPGRIKIKLTYDRTADPTTVSSIADAAVELAKRLKREDPSVRDLAVGFDRETVRREE